jgi:hypothetical protein
MSILWGAANNSGRFVIERKLRQAARILLHKHRQDPIKSDMYEKLKWLLPNDLYLFNLMCFVYQNIHSIKPCPYFSNVFITTGQIHNHETRSRASFYVPNLKLNNYGKRCISYAAAMKWNELPSEILTAPSLGVFKRRLKSYLLSRV